MFADARPLGEEGRGGGEGAPLREAGWPPGALWGVGTLPAGPRLAIVGARKADAYGVDVARRVAMAAALAGVPVVSGGAFGIDVAAHRGALAGGGTTVVVLGNGLLDPQPATHAADFVKAAAAGCVLSPFEPGQPGSTWTYPKRNPWIAALAGVVVVVQAARRSGSLQTAAAALELGRPVFVVPGPMDSPLHAGCHALLDQGARLLGGADGWRDALFGAPPTSIEGEATAPALGRRRTERAADSAPRPLPEGEPSHGLGLWRAASVEPQTLGELAEAAALELAAAAEQALMLELEGWLRSAPGGRYARSHPRA